MKILLTGSIAYDYLMVFPGYFKDHILPEHIEKLSLSFLVESMIRQQGGIAPNIAYTLALLGERPLLWGTVGEDFEEYRSWLENKGIDTSGARVIQDVSTASFFVTTDRANSQIASFFPGAMVRASDLSLLELKSQPPDLVMISPNDPTAMRLYVKECLEIGLPYIYDPSQQIIRLTEKDIKEGVRGAQALFTNEYEYALIQKMTGMSANQIVDGKVGSFVVVTCGDQGADIYTHGETFHIPIYPTSTIVDPTGVGDAFRGGFLMGFSKVLSFETCGCIGALAATYCLEHKGPQGHSFVLDEFISRYRVEFDDHGELEKLRIKPN